MRRPVVVGLLVVSLGGPLGGCESGRVDPLESFAAASCAAVQAWVDSIEDYTTELSRTVTALDTQAQRAPHYRTYTRSLLERTDDLVRQVRRLAPAAGDGRLAADALLAALGKSHAVVDELVALADELPDEGDTESLTGRISSLLVRLEKAFNHPSRARDELAERYDAFRTAPSCVDYDSPVT